MDSACILAYGIEKVCSQYDENLFADHVCSSSCSRLLWGDPGMRWSASISTIDFHHFCVSSIAPVVSKTRGPFVKETLVPCLLKCFLVCPQLDGVPNSCCHERLPVTPSI